MIAKELWKNQFWLKWFSGIDKEGDNIWYQCKWLWLNINGELHNILIDIWAWFWDELPVWIDNETIKEFDDIALTHNHYDHMGWLPIIAKSFLGWERWSKKGLYMSNVTAQTIKPILCDMTRHMESKTTRKNKKMKAEWWTDFIANLYKKEDIENIMKRRILIDPRWYETSSYKLFNDRMSIKALYAWHIFGANQYLFKITGNGKQKNTNILFTWDLGRISDPIHFEPPEIITTEKIDYMIIEWTYANREHNPRIEEQKKLTQTIRNRKGKLLIPTFSNTRFAQLILMIYESPDIYYRGNPNNDYDLWWWSKVFLDSKLWMELLKEICNYNGEIPWFSQQQVQTLKLILESVLEWKNVWPFAIASKKTILDRTNFDIIIAWWGMWEVWPSVWYIPRFLDNCDKNHIVFTWYQAQNTNGRKVQDEWILHIWNRFFDLSMDKFQWKNISSSISMSAHADQSDLLTYIDRTLKRDSCKIFIDHTWVSGYALKDKIIQDLKLRPDNIILPDLHKIYNFSI